MLFVHKNIATLLRPEGGELSERKDNPYNNSHCMACRNVCHGNTEDNGTGKYCGNVIMG